MVGKNGENKDAFFKWCPRLDFFGQYDAFKEHVKSKHKGCSFDCPKCQKVDVWRNEEQHRQVEHDKSHWWCMDCADVVQYKSEDEKERSESRNKHLLTMHKGYGECPICGDVVRMETIGSHARKKRHEKLYFWCFLCGECKKGDQSGHMRDAHRFCEICGTWVSNSFDHHYKKHEDCFFCPSCCRNFKDGAEHTKNVHPERKFCVCGACLLPDQVYKSSHVKIHSVHCPLCNKAESLNHMMTVHKCKKGVCKPIVSTKERTWKWQCDLSCKNFIVHCPLCKKAQPLSHMMIEHKCKEGVCKPIASTEELTWKWQCEPSCKNFIKPCPLAQIRGCQFTGSAEQLTVHMREEHKCEETCGFNESEDFVHGASCRNGPAYCSLCNCDVENRVLHWVKEHGCVEGCLIAIGREGKWHQVGCRNWTSPRCPRFECKATDVNREHIFKCLPTCGKSGCYLIQDNSEGGCVSIQHQGHSDEKEDFAVQEVGEVEDENIDYEPDYIEEV